MGSARLDPSPWNLGVPVLVMTACGPLVPFDETATDSNDSTIGTSPETTEVGPMTVPSATIDPSRPVECYTDEDCPPNHDCVDGHCYYAGYCDDDDYCCYDECCGPECGWYYDCYSNADCGVGYACNYGDCQPIDAELECTPTNLGFEIPIPVEGPIRALAFLQDGVGGADLLVGNDSGVYRVNSENIEVSSLGTPAFPAYGIAVRDLDADADLDVVVSPDVDGSAEVQVLTNDGAWTATPIPAMPALGSVATADVEADGFPDVYAYGPNGVYLAFNWGTSWSEPIYVFDYTTSLVTGDVDVDGFEDAVAHGYYTQAVYGGPALQVTQLYSGRYFGVARTLAIGSFTGNATPDVIGIEALPSATSLVAAWRAPVLQTEAYKSWWAYPFERAVTTDLNGDGYHDVVAASTYGYLGFAYGGPEPAPDVISCVGVLGSLPIAVLAAADFTGDGRADVAVSDGENLVVLVQTD